jgi:hypothetical protein
MPGDEPRFVISGVRFGHMPTKRPCNECPLRRSQPSGALGGYSPEGYIKLLHSAVQVACHLSKGFIKSGGTGCYDEQRHCTGVAIYRKNVGPACLPPMASYPQSPVYQSMQHVSENRVDVFDNPESFLEYHRGK